ncbi:MAG: stage V sporulation protein AB [Lachnospira sp.]
MIALYVLFGLGAGVVTSAGLFALISSIGLINRYAYVTESTDRIMLYEEMIILGATAGNLMYVFDISVPVGLIGCMIFGVISGIYVGTFLVCLAENIKGIPVFAHRLRLKDCLGFLILCIAAGKMVGELVYYIYLYK